MPHLNCVLVLVATLLTATPFCTAQLQFQCTTPKSSTKAANTFIGTTGSQIATSLLASNTPALFWGKVPSTSVRATCNQIVNTGTHTINAHVTGDSWGGPSSYDIQLQLIATGGCNAAQDNSGTEFVFTDPSKRKIALVCPPKAGSVGCGIYWTGNDVSALFSKSKSGRRLQSTRKMLDCDSGAGVGATVVGAAAASGAAGGLADSAFCVALGPFAPFCVAGVVGVSAAVGAGIGCAASAGCFPGNALVTTEMGSHMTMGQLAIGDKVAVMGPHNSVKYEEVYAFGHQNATAMASMVQLQLQHLQHPTADGPVLTLTPFHFLPLINGVQTRAEVVQRGDFVWAKDTATQKLLPHNVTGVGRVWEQGLFNPLTLGGSILVNDVAASVHSEWFLDDLFDSLKLTALLPAAYQIILAPARALLFVLGTENYARLYHYLDSHVDVATSGTAHGGKIAASAGVSMVVAVAMLSKRAFVSKVKA